MISVEEATSILNSHTIDFGIKKIHLNHCTGRILRENIYADTDMPPFDRVAMDGIAINSVALSGGQKTFFIEGMAAAGAPQQVLRDNNHCIEIMTGAVCPHNADTIIPYEWISIENNVATLLKDNIRPGQNIHRKGTDKKQGDMLINAGQKITAGEISILASVGKSEVAVSILPKVLVIATGDELVDINETPLPHQVRVSNALQLQYAMHHLNIEADRIHLKDDYQIILKTLQRKLTDYNVIIISGGLSAGKFDHIPSVLEVTGVEQHFYKVAQKPGKPFYFGTHPEGCIVFGIPGNPVSAFLCYVRYIQPFLEDCLQKNKSYQPIVKLAEVISINPKLTTFVAIRIEQNDLAQLIAIPVKGHGSGDFSILAEATAFVELPQGKAEYAEGEILKVYRI